MNVDKMKLNRNKKFQKFENENLDKLDSGSNGRAYNLYSFSLLQRQDSLKKDIAGFDIDQLKPAEVLEKLSLPTQEDIEFEKNIIEEETAANKETFSKGWLISEIILF